MATEGRRIKTTTSPKQLQEQAILTTSQATGEGSGQPQASSSSYTTSVKRGRTSRITFIVSLIRSCCCCRSSSSLSIRESSSRKDTREKTHQEEEQAQESISFIPEGRQLQERLPLESQKLEITAEVFPSSSPSLSPEQSASSTDSAKIGTGVGTSTTEEGRQPKEREAKRESMRSTKSYTGREEVKAIVSEKVTQQDIETTTASLTLSSKDQVEKEEDIKMVSCTTIDPEKSQKIVMPSSRQQQQEQITSIKTTAEEDKKQRLRFLRMRRHTVSSSSSVRPSPDEASKWAHSFNIMMGHKCEYMSCYK